MFDKKRDDEVLDVARAIQLFPKPKLARRESEVRARARIFQDEILPAAVLEFESTSAAVCSDRFMRKQLNPNTET
ncbi:MAG: hypothetical protein DCC52_14565 [Chloroflexi bacterium]|nr:MAG: hypothetical protein DCC52_14565 [Chloroflexota bacterium]